MVCIHKTSKLLVGFWWDEFWNGRCYSRGVVGLGFGWRQLGSIRPFSNLIPPKLPVTIIAELQELQECQTLTLEKKITGWWVEQWQTIWFNSHVYCIRFQIIYTHGGVLTEQRIIGIKSSERAPHRWLQPWWTLWGWRRVHSPPPPPLQARRPTLKPEEPTLERLSEYVVV